MSILAERIRKIRTDVCDLSMRAVAERAGCNVATVWKVENDEPVSYKMFERILVSGLQIAIQSSTFRELQALWIDSRGAAGLIDMQSAQNVAIEANSHRVQALAERLLPLLGNVPAKCEDALIAVLSNKTAIAVLPSLARLAQHSDHSTS